MSFAVVRHPDIEAPGILPQGAFEAHQARGWYRVSDWQAEPSFNLPDYPADAPDLDAPPPPEPAPEPEPESTEDTGRDDQGETA